MRRVGPGTTVESSDGPAVFLVRRAQAPRALRCRRNAAHAAFLSPPPPPPFPSLQHPHIPTVHRKGVDFADAMGKGAGVALTTGVLRGSGVETPAAAAPSSSPSAAPTSSSHGIGRGGSSIVFIESIKPGKRAKDPNSVESIHRRAMESSSASSSASPSASPAPPTPLGPYHAVFGSGTRYVDKGVAGRAVTPIYASHQRLTTLEATLSQMQLWSGEAGVTQRRGPKERDALAQTAASQPLPSVFTQLGTTRFDGTARRTGGAGVDGSATRAYGWTPSFVAGGGGAGAGPSPLAATLAATATREGVDRGCVMDVPPQPSLLRPRVADPAALLSRGSRSGITPRAYSSALDRSLSALVATRAAAGGGGGDGEAGAGLGAEGGGSTAPASSFDDLYSPMAGGGGGGGGGGGASSSPSSSPRAAGPSAAAASSTGRSFSPPHLGGATWTTRTTHSLARMQSGPALVQEAALQARFTYRAGPRHNVPLTHAFLEEGIWTTMNFKGDSRSPTRRPLDPSPLPVAAAGAGGAGGRGAASASYGGGGGGVGDGDDSQVEVIGGDDEAGPSSPGFAPSRAGGGGVGVAGFPPLEEQRTALGGLLAERLEATTRPLPPEAFPATTAAATAPITHASSGRFAREMVDLDTFDSLHDMGNPTHWPKKALRAKIAASGVADAIGLTPELLARADKATLLAAYERIPSTKRMLAVLGAETPTSARSGGGGGGGTRATSAATARSGVPALPLHAQNHQLSSSSAASVGLASALSSLLDGPGAAVANTNVFMGLTNEQGAMYAEALEEARRRG